VSADLRLVCVRRLTVPQVLYMSSETGIKLLSVMCLSRFYIVAFAFYNCVCRVPVLSYRLLLFVLFCLLSSSFAFDYAVTSVSRTVFTVAFAHVAYLRTLVSPFVSTACSCLSCV
jgi:hypothetical protein